jgi:hypothetical protein
MQNLSARYSTVNEMLTLKTFIYGGTNGMKA